MTGVLKLRSLQARLLALVLALITVIWLGAALVMWLDARHELEELLDDHLTQTAALLVVQSEHADGDADDGFSDTTSMRRYAPQVAFQVYRKGHLVMRSIQAGDTPMAGITHGFSTVRAPDGVWWRVFATAGTGSDTQVYVGELDASRNAILMALLRSVLLPLVLALPIMALALWWAIRHGLAPLRELGQVLGRRQPRALEPVVLVNMTTEMAPMVQALNELFERIAQMVASERRFTADAAHELRTPIAVIRAQAQVALGAGGDAAQRDHALHATLAGCDRATRLVEQLLTLARLETSTLGSAVAASASVDLSGVVRRVVADLAPGALARQQCLELEAHVACPVSGNEMLLGVLVRNLVDNALRYSPDGARAHVSVTQADGQVVMTVRDSGPGMSEPDMAQLGERFFRVLGSEQPGSGLGWSIVWRIAKVSAADLQVARADELGGLAVTVRWPVARGIR
jgi:two-component system sensor histidine kinase QseC